MLKYQILCQKASKYLLISALALSFGCKDDEKVVPPDNIWTGPETTFTKETNADWTLTANQDRISDKIVFTRQNRGPIYNYQWWITNFEEDATFEDLSDEFWNNENSEREFVRSGGTTGVRWAILDDTDSDDTDAWKAFDMYGKLGDPANFYSFHNIASILGSLEDNEKVLGVEDDFSIIIECEDCGDGGDGTSTTDGTIMPALVDKKLGVWLVEEDIYLTFTFKHWGSNNEDNGVSYTRSTKD